MIPVLVLLLALLLFRGIGAIGVESLASWQAATRWALGVMLLFTAGAHFTTMKENLVRMVPPWVPRPRLAVTFTGVCEILGAVGLVLPPFQRAAGVALVLFFVAVFPANVHAARVCRFPARQAGDATLAARPDATSLHRPHLVGRRGGELTGRA